MGTWYDGVEANRAGSCCTKSHSTNTTTVERMKISAFPTLLLLIATAAIGFLAYHIAKSNTDPNDILVGVGTGVSVLLSLGCVLGVSLEDGRMNVNMKAWSITAFIIVVVINLCFAFFGVTMPYYVIVLALTLVIHLWVVWKLSIIKNV
jgi:hypothetical protein